MLDLKKEVVLTMFNSLEKVLSRKGNKFFKLEGILPEKIGIRFYKPIEEIAAKSDFIAQFLTIAKECQGVYNASLQDLSYTLKMSPFHIPKILFGLQSSEEISYETDHESFVLKILHLPLGSRTLEFSQEMLNETRKVERNMSQKLNCMYFVAKRVSLASIEVMNKREKEQSDNGEKMYREFS